MRRYEAQGETMTIEERGNRAARFTPWNAQINALNVIDGKAREYCIAEMLMRGFDCRSGNGNAPTRPGEILKHVKAAGSERHFLQRDDVRVQFTNDVRDALWLELTVATDADVYVVGSDFDAARGSAGVAFALDWFMHAWRAPEPILHFHAIGRRTSA